MEGDFRLSRLERKSGIPDAAIRSAEAAAFWARVRKRGIDNVILGHPENQFMHCNSRQQIGLAGQTCVGGVVEFEEVFHLCRRKVQSRQYTLALFIKLVRN